MKTRSVVNTQAEELNAILRGSSPILTEFLSRRALAMYFPYKGILGQSGQAKGLKYNATIGIACEDDLSPMRLNSLDELHNLGPKEAYPYAPSFGDPELRKVWKTMISNKNPGLTGKNFGTPVVSQALTHGITLSAMMFLDPGDEVLVPDPYWDNYNLLFEESLGAKVATFPCFSGESFNLKGLEAALETREGRKVNLLLNFPNNPTGYTPTSEEMSEIVAILKKSAEAGTKLVVMIDDAYFGLVYENGVATESIFSELVDLHTNIMAVKIDGATKEDYVWGFRVGFITFGHPEATEEAYKALNDKLGGFIRGTISNCSMLSQSMLLKAYTDDNYASQKAEKYQTLKGRYDTLKAELESHPEYSESFSPLPYNSGYFMCIQPTEGVDAEEVRKLLIEKYETGLIALSGLLRIAFSSAPANSIPAILSNVHQAIQEVKGA